MELDDAINRLDAKEWQVRRDAIYSLESEINANGVVRQRVVGLLRDDDEAVSSTAFSVLLTRRIESAFDEMYETLKDDDDFFNAVSDVLFAHADGWFTDRVIDVLEMSESDDDREFAAFLLGWPLTTERAKHALSGFATDATDSTTAAVEEALKHYEAGNMG